MHANVSRFNLFLLKWHVDIFTLHMQTFFTTQLSMTLIDQSTVQSADIAYFIWPFQGRYEYSKTEKKMVLGYAKVKNRILHVCSFFFRWGKKVSTAHLHIHTIYWKQVGKESFYMSDKLSLELFIFILGPELHIVILRAVM